MPLHPPGYRSIPPTPEPARAPTDADFERYGLQPYKLQAPEWRLPIQVNQPEFGFPGLHPTHIGQQEDAMTKSLVQGGFSARTLTESFSAHQMIYKKLSDDTSVNLSSAALSALIEARRRYYAITAYDTKSTIKVPGRVTLTDQKRENWLRDLADNSVPLLKLSKNVPHGFKGERLLEMLVNRKVDASRATWYIRLIGLYEISPQRNKNDSSHIRYSLSFTADVCQFLQRQLAEVTVPSQSNLLTVTASLITSSSRLAGMHVRSKPRSSTLSDPETRKNWVAKWGQTCQLVKRLYFESLLDQPTFFKWLVDQVKTANLAQLNFILEIHRSMMDRFCLSSNLVRGFVEASLSQIRFISKQTSTSFLSKLEYRLRIAVQSSFLTCPDGFVWPELWTSNRVLLEDIILSNVSVLNTDDEPLKQKIKSDQSKEVLRNDFFTINWRVSQLIGETGFGTGIVRNTFTRRAQLVEILDSCTDHADYEDGSKLYYKYFINPTLSGHAVVPFKDKLEVLLSWSTTPLRTSDKRVYLTANALSSVKRDRKKNDDEFQNILISWLEQIETSEGCDLLVRLFSELSRRNIFSYGAYVQRMVARGDTEHDMLVGKASGVRTLLSEWMPLASSSKLYRGLSCHLKRSPGRDTSRNNLMTVIADMASAITAADYFKFLMLITRRLDVSNPTSANRKILAEILPKSLVSLILDISSLNPITPTTSFHVRSSFPTNVIAALLAWASQLLESSKAYSTLDEVVNRIIHVDLSRLEAMAPGDGIYSDTHRSFQSAYNYLQVLCLMVLSSKDILELDNKLEDIISRLFTIYVQMRRLTITLPTLSRGFGRCLRNLVVQSRMTNGQILQVLDQENHFTLEHNSPFQASSPTKLLPSVTREIINLFQSPSPDHTSGLVSRYWKENRADIDWGPTFWNSLVAALNISSHEQLTGNSGQNKTYLDHWISIRGVLLQLCEDVDVLYHEGLIGCVIRAGSVVFPHPDDETLFRTLVPVNDLKLASEEGEEDEDEDVTTGDAAEAKVLNTPRSLTSTFRRLLVKLISLGLLDIQAVLEEYVLRPIVEDIPNTLFNIFEGHNDECSVVSPQQLKRQTKQLNEVLRQMEELNDLTYVILGFSESACAQSDSQEQPKSMARRGLPDTPDLSNTGKKAEDAESGIEGYVQSWKLQIERKQWFEKSDDCTTFFSRLLLSTLILMKTINEYQTKQDGEENSRLERPVNTVLNQILDIFERIRKFACNDLQPLRRVIFVQSAVFFNPIFQFIENNDLGSGFNTSLLRSVDELLPYPYPPDLSNHKYPHLESIFKSTCIFNHCARTRQFQLHLRLLMSQSPPQMAGQDPVDLGNTLGALVETMGRRLHLTDSKDLSPFFLDSLSFPVAEALVIKLTAYLGVSISKLFGPNQTDPNPEVTRIHHICRCISALTPQLITKTIEKNGDEMIQIMGGTGTLACNATIDSYTSYWGHLKAGLINLYNRIGSCAMRSDSDCGLKRIDFRIMRGLLHSTQVILWSLPGSTSHLNQLNYAIADSWVKIALRVQGDKAMSNQIMDTVAVLLFPQPPEESTLNNTIGILRRSFRWLYQPVLKFEEASNLGPISRLKYILGSSLRGSTSTFQQRAKDGAVKFVEERAWEELEKVDPSGPGFISIDALKCQTLSQVEPVPESKQSTSHRTKNKRLAGGEGDDVMMGEEVEVECNEDRRMNYYQQEEEEEGPMKGERDSFEHELITDGLSLTPLHFLRSLYPTRNRLEGEDWINSCNEQLMTNDQVFEEQQESQEVKSLRKRKISPVDCLQNNSSSGPNLRSLRSTRKKNQPMISVPLNNPSNIILPTTSNVNKRTSKKR